MGREEEGLRSADGPSDAEIRKKITDRSKGGELACAQAFQAAEELGVSPAVIGQYADAMELKLSKCQLGLFGYMPDKKIVRRRETVEPELLTAIEESLENGRLSCAAAWRIADRFGIRKMDVSGACETLGIKIKPCQLGAF